VGFEQPCKSTARGVNRPREMAFVCWLVV
jgi:hypothetical protein